MMGEKINELIKKTVKLENARKVKKLITAIDWTGKRFKEKVYQEKGYNFPLKGEKVIAIEDIDEEFNDFIKKGTILTVESYNLIEDTYTFCELGLKYFPYLHENIGQKYPSRYFKKYLEPEADGIKKNEDE